jgi:hypothetical protein
MRSGSPTSPGLGGPRPSTRACCHGSCAGCVEEENVGRSVDNPGSFIDAPYRLVYYPRASGNGSAYTLPMSDEEKAAAAEREKNREPLGFALPPTTKRR